MITTSQFNSWCCVSQCGGRLLPYSCVGGSASRPCGFEYWIRNPHVLRICGFFLFAWKKFCTWFQAWRSSTYITYLQFFVNAQAKINKFDFYLKKLLTQIFNKNVFQIGFFKLGSHVHIQCLFFHPNQTSEEMHENSFHWIFFCMHNI